MGKLVIIAILMGIIGSTTSFANADSPPGPQMTITFEDLPGTSVTLLGRRTPSDQSPVYIVPNNGIAKWSVPVALEGANPILTATIPVKVVGLMNTPIEATVNVVMSWYAASLPDAEYVVKYYAIRDAETLPKGLDEIERIAPASEPFRFKRLLQGAQILSVYEAIPNMFDAPKARAARIMYEGAVELHRRTETESVVYIPDRATVSKFVSYFPASREDAWGNREKMLWLVMRRIIEPAIISADRWDKSLKKCLSETDQSSLGNLQYRTVQIGFTKVKVVEKQVSVAPSIAACSKVVQADICPDAKMRLSRIKYLFDQHSMRSEFRAAYSRMVAGSSPPKEANLVADARIRYEKLCQDESFASLYSGAPGDAARLSQLNPQ